MKILYGVQGTGNGHTTRARIMAKALANAGAQVDWVFSGRERDKFFDMEAFGNFQSYRGLTFATQSGKVLFLKTALNSNLTQLYRDTRDVNVEGYDFIINDFEPVSAWAAKRAGKKVIGISHQNAFFYDIPKADSNIFTNWFMHNFAPVTMPIGLHWHHFNQPILPPMVEQANHLNYSTPKHYLVYLPFAGVDDIVPQLREFPEYDFFVYQPVPAAYDEGHIHVRPFSREGFQADLHRCEGVICSAGFELPSEAIHLGKKILVQPVAGQMEQKSNALALEKLGYGQVAKHFDVETLGKWLPLKAPTKARDYPDVAKALVNWLLQGGGEDIRMLQQQLWQETIEVENSENRLFAK
ncbi:glycosyl transferase [Cellvibrio sp. KY-GH-1]|uniref:MJ1255/VC2487 family glycosyltransferase n=1 Tax=Cellvibrio sp. KY-GH-1 TaxID=2303332 RepID=UPI001247BF00|nr:MJ1255/VC2487 family glycosyltransferase [Cellvibrio sp. KY-GH-1]QEY15733.1 glycosyl transferase [Cellvibrio sp. KY-GH-1]